MRISVKAAEQAQKEFRRNQQVAETAKKKKAGEKRRKVRTRVLLLSAMLRSRERENQRVISDSLRLTRCGLFVVQAMAEESGAGGESGGQGDGVGRGGGGELVVSNVVDVEKGDGDGDGFVGVAP